MIKNLLFDLGGVIMDIRRERCIAAFEALGMADIGDFLGDYSQQGVFAGIEQGLISPAGFRQQVRRHIPRPVTDSQIDHAFMQFLVGIPLHRLEALRTLARHYDIYLLSNTNPIMWNGFIADQFGRQGLTREDYFKGMVTSFEAKALKPDPAIFDYTARHLHIDPAETLFLDDSEANCEAARRCGYKAAHVAPGTEFIDILAALGLNTR